MVVISAICLSALGLVLSLIPVRLQVSLGSETRSLTIRYWKLTIVDNRHPHRKPKLKTQKEQSESDKSTRSESAGSRKRFALWQWSQIRRSQIRRYAGLAPQLTRALLGFAARVVNSMRLQNVRGSVSGGFADPADTGIVFAALYAIVGAVPGLQSRMEMKPDYLAERILYDLSGEIALRPVALFGPSVRLIRDLPKRELLKVIWRQRRARKEVKRAQSSGG